MLTTTQAKEILTALSILPPERILEVQNFILSLKDRYGLNKPVNESETWTEEDIHDLTVTVLKHADQSL